MHHTHLKLDPIVTPPCTPPIDAQIRRLRQSDGNTRTHGRNAPRRDDRRNLRQLPAEQVQGVGILTDHNTMMSVRIAHGVYETDDGVRSQ